jgi:hypothetical protein
MRRHDRVSPIMLLYVPKAYVARLFGRGQFPPQTLATALAVVVTGRRPMCESVCAKSKLVVLAKQDECPCKTMKTQPQPHQSVFHGTRTSCVAPSRRCGESPSDRAAPSSNREAGDFGDHHRRRRADARYLAMFNLAMEEQTRQTVDERGHREPQAAERNPKDHVSC